MPSRVRSICHATTLPCSRDCPRYPSCRCPAGRALRPRARSGAGRRRTGRPDQRLPRRARQLRGRARAPAGGAAGAGAGAGADPHRPRHLPRIGAASRPAIAADHAEPISVDGPQDAPAAMAAIRERYCGALLSGAFCGGRHGAPRQRAGRSCWPTADLRRPCPSRRSRPGPPGPGQRGARPAAQLRRRSASARPRRWPGTRRWPRRRWRTAADMATQHYFSHEEPDGSTPAERASPAPATAGRGSAKTSPRASARARRRWTAGWTAPATAPTS